MTRATSEDADRMREPEHFDGDVGRSATSVVRGHMPA